MNVLNEQAQSVLCAAQDAMKNAYAPYSGYSVGAAFRAEEGGVFVGANVENASYGLTICAERAALFASVSAGQKTFVMGAIVASGPSMPVPCGACRQVMAEFCSPEMPLYVALEGQLASAQVFTLGQLLPHSFSSSMR